MLTKQFLVAETPSRLYGRVFTKTIGGSKINENNLMFQRYGAEKYNDGNVHINRIQVEKSYLTKIEDMPSIDVISAAYCNELLQSWLMVYQRLPSSEVTTASETLFQEGSSMGSASVVARNENSVLVEMSSANSFGISASPCFNKEKLLVGYTLELSRYLNTEVGSIERYYLAWLTYAGAARLLRKYSHPGMCFCTSCRSTVDNSTIQTDKHSQKLSEVKTIQVHGIPCLMLICQRMKKNDSNYENSNWRHTNHRHQLEISYFTWRLGVDTCGVFLLV